MFVVASIRPALLALGITICAGAGLMLPSAAHAKYSVSVNNQTGHTVSGFVFTDGKVHTSSAGGTPFGTIKDGESAVVDVASCNYQIFLVDGTENWHSEYKDCERTHITIFSDSGREKPKNP